MYFCTFVAFFIATLHVPSNSAWRKGLGLSLQPLHLVICGSSCLVYILQLQLPNIYILQDCIYPYILQARAGSYMCESSNSVGKGRSKEITLDIKCKLPFSKLSNPHSLPPDVPVCASPEPEIYGVSKSELVDIVCRVKANPSEVSSQRCILLSPPYQQQIVQTFPSRLKRLPFFG